MYILLSDLSKTTAKSKLAGKGEDIYLTILSCILLCENNDRMLYLVRSDLIFFTLLGGK